jgi:ABC-type nitrate/sulfonate/bicarbonate transport system ATPase subunit
MQELIVSLWQEHGFTVLLVTHDVSEAVAMADRVLLIEEKKIGLDLTWIFRDRGAPVRRSWPSWRQKYWIG